MDNFYKAGINCVVTQTGFLDAYNWQDINNAKLIDAGDGKTYMHVAFMVSGISFSDGITNAPTYLELDMDDKNYHCIDTHNLKEEGSRLAKTAAKLLSGMSIKLYGYDNTAAINPNTPQYQVNNALIERIHS